MGAFTIASASHGAPPDPQTTGEGEDFESPPGQSRGCGQTSVEGDKLSGLTRNCPVRHGPPAAPPALT
ncbi:hypothetical protein PBI_JOHANN_48 [Microbacterium phage Johann]|uniref:Uncharacterized protein n=2 Tax=Goodmanvirus goodman TaxID=2734238 RepID=A0A3G3M0A6_9CAUD|nr:hypothetical protein HOU56_gp48 [Microbacterium phage Goodman]AYQ99518.1 hypothetical protein PBI_GOODMAN_48 [Microbacterium phage Goodman]AYQ99686.1 hypothetical protein PBI_JOHANN_48 [Microbacterium phage Johann]